MSYGYIYVAQVAMGADQNQTIKLSQRLRLMTVRHSLSATLRAKCTPSRAV